MAICKIIPIKQKRGVHDAYAYISDEGKVISIQKNEETGKFERQVFEQLDAELEDTVMAKLDFHTVLAYMKNDEKTQHTEDLRKKFVSGFQCSPETAVEEFMNVKEENLYNQGKTLDEETGNWAYHIIQSFPENLNISDEEVHQCGRELCEKLALYQAVICSHVHPVINEEEEVSGKCKHNHILMNSHMLPGKIDPEHPEVFKYHDCKATYTQLQKWNDEISLAHGLPIIRNPDLDRKYSWYKSKMENEDASWTKQVARDIKNTMRFCSNWEQFKQQMTEQGYFIRESGKTITYYTPEHSETNKQQIREKRLGREYTKDELERYWETVAKTKTEPTKTEERPSGVPLIQALVAQYGADLFAEVKTKNKHRTYTLDVPIVNPRRQRAEDTIRTYFKEDEEYNLCTSDHVPIAQITGQDLLDYYAVLNEESKTKYADPQEYYTDPTKENTETHKPYKVPLWENNGRRRTQIELKCIMACIIIKKEHVESTPKREPNLSYRGADGKFVYAKTEWKLQNMYNTITLARDMKVNDAAEVEQKLNRTGKEVARIRKQNRRLTEQCNQMDTIHENLKIMEATKSICETIYQMPDGETKEAAQLAHATELAQYTAAKRYLHAKNISTPEQIQDFKQRYASMTAHLREVRTNLDNVNQEYRNLRKIQYNITLAQNNYYCYGPDHPRFAAEQQKTTEQGDIDSKQ